MKETSERRFPPQDEKFFSSSSESPATTASNQGAFTQVSFATHSGAHAITCSKLIEQLSSNAADGLTIAEAANRLAANGRNEIGDGPKSPSMLIIFLRQVCNAMTVVLLAVTGVTFYIRSYAEGGVVVFIVLLNVGLGVYQEWGAEKSMAALRGLSAPTATVVRDGHNKVILAREVVTGDMVELVTGDGIPADIR
jgi:magnesium-transporting ATPase (P-type)